MPYGEMAESRIKTAKSTKKKEKRRKKGNMCRICAPKQALQFPKIFRTRFGEWLFVYP
jgi:hypothetical protein